ncbi:MAG: hypothetical protein KatS3mg008_2067 [Acidimicrobiales bacterium]|nr:MAG: hypothetical protein KatS3mg008_2067 [Acidimicrobiales bacterium]
MSVTSDGRRVTPGSNGRRTRGARSATTSDERLARLVIPKERRESYVPRELPGGITDIDLLKRARDRRENVLLVGPTGSGKTAAVEALAAELELPLVILQCNGALDPTVVFGLREIVDGETRFEESDAVRVIRAGGVLYFDEINFIRQEIASIFFPLLDSRRVVAIPEMHGEKIVAHPDLFIVASMNPSYTGTHPLSDALKNRFAHHLRFEYDERIESRLLRSKTLRQLAKRLRSGSTMHLVSPVSTNKLIELEQLAEEVGIEYAVSNFVNYFTEDEQGAVGEIVLLYKDAIATDLGLSSGARSDVKRKKRGV